MRAAVLSLASCAPVAMVAARRAVTVARCAQLRVLGAATQLTVAGGRPSAGLPAHHVRLFSDSGRDRSGARTGQVDPLSVFVGNLPYDVATAEVRELFETVGTVSHVDLFRHNGMAVGSGVVQFATAEDAQRAKDELHDVDLNGRPLFVRDNFRTLMSSKNYQILIQHLPPKSTWWEVKDLVRAVAPVGHVMHQDRRALVQLEKDEDVERVLQDLDGREFDGATLLCSVVPLTSSLRQGFESVARHQLLIRNIPRLARWQDVKDLCKQYGSVSHVKLVKSGTAIVHMATDEEAQHALESLDGAFAFGHTLQVQWRKHRGE